MASLSKSDEIFRLAFTVCDEPKDDAVCINQDDQDQGLLSHGNKGACMAEL